MSAILYPSSQWAQAQRGSNTGSTPPPLPAAAIPDVTHYADMAARGGMSDLGSFFSGGIHPEQMIATAPPTDATVPTDSQIGNLGGLTPKLGSTVSPGPAGAAASVRKTLGDAAKKLGL
jgi:hypothetical protein